MITISVIAQAPDCSIITYNTDAQSRLEIDNLDRLQCMSEDLTADYILLNDIDASPTQTWNGGTGFQPIGTTDFSFISPGFSGSLNGGGYKIFDLYINAPEQVFIGLFGYLDINAEVENLGMEDVNITGGFAVAGIAGGLNTGTLAQVYVTGTINGYQAVAGLVGYYIDQGSISTSFNTASISGSSDVGGLIGLAETSTDIPDFTIFDSYSSGEIIMIGDDNIEGGGLFGGLDPSNFAQKEDSYWNVESSGIGVGYGGGFGVTTIEMKTQSTFFSWDFSSIWAIDEGNSYPYLLGNPPSTLPGINDTSLVTPFSGGIGTFNDPFQIENVEQLQAMDEYENYIFELINDIDASSTASWNNGEGFDPLGSSKEPFFGSLSGNNYKITGLTINRPDSNYIGLFANNEIFGIRDLALEEVSIIGKNYVGAMAGRNTSVISRSYVSGSVKGDSIVGGLVGYHTESSINETYSLATVSGYSHVGGLVGYNESNINRSYSAGKVTGKVQTGGLVGANSGLLSSSTNDSYWNVESSSISESAGGMPRNTEQMKLRSTFSVWWDFPGWDIIERETYPFLQDNPPDPLPGSNQNAVYAGGFGTISSPFEIENVNQLQNITNNLSSNFILNTDINAAGTALWDNGQGFSPIGSSDLPFNGSIDGKGFSVKRLAINRPLQDTVGVFYVIGSGAEVRNLGFEGVNIEGRNVVGGLAGLAEDSTVIENTFIMGQVTGVNNVGGVLGSSNGSIEYAYSISNVTGNENVGGIAGSAANGSTISSTYAAGNVNGTNNIGGILGLNTDATISDSYWNTETGGVAEAVGQGLAGVSSGLTTAEMMQPNSYTNWDFDFEGNWFIVSDQNYPWLQDNEQNPAPGPVTLISPGDGGDVAIPTMLEWKVFPEANSYEIKIGTDAEMETVIFDTTNIQSPTLNLVSATLFEENQTYYWKVRPDNANWSAVNAFTVLIVTSTEPGTDIPDSYALSQNYPNPFNPNTSIRFSVPENAHVNLEVFDLLGRRISKLVDEDLAPGNYSVKFEASNFSSGVYIYRIKSGDFVSTKKMLLLK